MKKAIGTMMILSVLTLISFAQVPDSIRMGFEKKYPNSNAVWNTDNGVYSATYSRDNRQYMVGYDNKGTMIWSRSQVTGSDIPKSISSYYRTNYPNQSDYIIWREDNTTTGKPGYYSTMGNDRLYFDSSGSFIRKDTSPKQMNSDNPQ
jgi:hypothetical protein